MLNSNIFGLAFDRQVNRRFLPVAQYGFPRYDFLNGSECANFKLIAQVRSGEHSRKGMPLIGLCNPTNGFRLLSLRVWEIITNIS